MALELRVELFSTDLDRFVDFYVGVLGFAVVSDRRRDDNGYVAVRRDGVRIGAVPAGRTVDREHRAVPVGTELVLECDDVRAERDRVVAAGWTLAADLESRPWGLTDFRVFDPDGYYLRFTDRAG